MPITRSAKKAVRQNLRRRTRNVKNKEAVKKVLKEYRKLVAAKKIDGAQKLLPTVFKTLDKVAKAGVIKKNAASRLKSRMAHLMAKSVKASS